MQILQWLVIMLISFTINACSFQQGPPDPPSHSEHSESGCISCVIDDGQDPLFCVNYISNSSRCAIKCQSSDVYTPRTTECDRSSYPTGPCYSASSDGGSNLCIYYSSGWNTSDASKSCVAAVGAWLDTSSCLPY